MGKIKNFKSGFTLNSGLTQTSGFTLIEIIIVVAIFIILFSVSTMSLSGLIPRANFVTSHQSMLSDIKGQQHRAMTGDTGGGVAGSAYGIYLEANQYTLFTGSTYNPGAADNFTIKLSSGLDIAEVTFPNNTLVFLQNSGEIDGFGEATSSFKLTGTSTGESELINLNWLGVVIPN